MGRNAFGTGRRDKWNKNCKEVNDDGINFIAFISGVYSTHHLSEQKFCLYLYRYDDIGNQCIGIEDSEYDTYIIEDMCIGIIRIKFIGKHFKVM